MGFVYDEVWDEIVQKKIFFSSNLSSRDASDILEELWEKKLEMPPSFSYLVTPI